MWTQLFSEPDAGSDLASLRTTAERDGDQYVVNGQKIWSTWANRSQWGILLARTDPTVAKHQGISYFVVDMATPGVEVRKIIEMTGPSRTASAPRATDGAWRRSRWAMSGLR